MKSLSIWLMITILGGLLFLLSLPISNLCIERTYVAGPEDREFKLVSDTMTKKCADCHSPDMAQRPIYFNFPIANSIIREDLKNAQSSFVLTRSKLSGAEKFTANEIFALSQAMVKGSMPPVRYICLYWDAALSEKEQKFLVDWIKKRAAVFEIRTIPDENFFQPDPKKAALGEKLFNDKRLSADNTISCASCHQLEKGGCDQLPTSKGVGGRMNRRNTPTVLNAAYNFVQYWDGGARDLKEVVSRHVNSPEQMNSNWNQVLAKLSNDQDYLSSFNECYAQGVTADGIADAISVYVHTLLTPGSRFDKFLNGDKNALNEDEKAGFEVFKKHECSTCHAGPALGGLSFEKEEPKVKNRNLSHPAPDSDNSAASDLGRFVVTRSSKDKYKFKVPTLRNVELTFPYFHDGSAKTLEDAVRVMSETQVESPLTESELKQVSSFLRSLTGQLKGKTLRSAK